MIRISNDFDDSEDIANVGTVKQEDNRKSLEPFDLKEILSYKHDAKPSDALQQTEKILIPQLKLSFNEPDHNSKAGGINRL